MRPDVYATLGRALAASGETQRAVDLFEQCLEDVSRETPEDFTAQVRFTTYLSYALTDLGDLERAEAVLQDAIARAEDATDAYSRVRLYWSVARLNDVQGRSAAALTYIRRAIALLDVTDDTLHLARAHLLAGSIMLSQENIPGARRHFELAERLYGPSAEPDDLAGLYSEQSKLAALDGDADEAVLRAQAAVDAAADEYLRERGSALWALADAKALKGDVDGADDAFRQATELLRDHGHRRDHIEAHRAWGKFLRRAGREEQALEVLERAADLAAEPAAVEAHRLR
jgi:tetratricopeptide (TPR) repeat protein